MCMSLSELNEMWALEEQEEQKAEELDLINGTNKLISLVELQRRARSDARVPAEVYAEPRRPRSRVKLTQ